MQQSSDPGSLAPPAERGERVRERGFRSQSVRTEINTYLENSAPPPHEPQERIVDYQQLTKHEGSGVQSAKFNLGEISPYRACLKMAMVTAARLLCSTFVARSLQAHEGYARRLRLG